MVASTAVPMTVLVPSRTSDLNFWCSLAQTGLPTNDPRVASPFPRPSGRCGRVKRLRRIRGGSIHRAA